MNSTAVSGQRSTNLDVLGHVDAGHYRDVLSPVGRVRLKQTEQVSEFQPVYRGQREEGVLLGWFQMQSGPR